MMSRDDAIDATVVSRLGPNGLFSKKKPPPETPETSRRHLRDAELRTFHKT